MCYQNSQIEKEISKKQNQNRIMPNWFRLITNINIL